MLGLKLWFAQLVSWRSNPPRHSYQKRRNRVRSKPYFPDLVDLDDWNNTWPAVECKPEDTELPVIRTLGELQPSAGSFIPLARQCLRCERILSELGSSSNIARIVHFDPTMLRDSAMGCELCFVILQGIARHGCLEDIAKLIVRVDANHAHIIVNSSGQDIRFQSVPYLPCPWIQLGPGHDIGVPGSMQCLQRIKKWISQCESNHQCRSAVATADWLPSRVIDIGADGKCVQLKDTTKTKIPPGRYLCLSHCWGAQQTLTTTTKNIDLHCAKLDQSQLPRTYRDTICVARLLGIPYVWIDSLCIIQDDDDDWARESSAMASIYENAYLTIGATSSRDSSGGLFSARRVRQELICGRRYGADGAPYLIAAVEDIPHPKLGDEPRKLAENWPLLTRAWVFQERILSPRVIHFASPEMYWECREMSSCECGRLRESTKSRYEKTSNDDSPELLRKQWWEMVQSYSALNLSYADDKLPALSGIATKMSSRRLDATYLAGLWSDSLDLDLLWINKDAMVPGKAVNTRPSEWRAPTWTWASIDAPIKFPFKDHTEVQIHFKVIHAFCKPGTKDKTGRVSRGSLTLEAPAVSGEITTAGSMDQRTELKIGDTTYTLTGGNRFYPDNPGDPFGIGLGMVHSVKEVLCMGLATGSGFHSQTRLALVLYRPNKMSLYKRIGMLYQWCEVTRSANPNLAIYGWPQNRPSGQRFEPLEGELKTASIL
ncbi:HET-domain-containing protein [Fusarium austroafricanum]|uniref:HET-domain-containing protein n=1 Tax=Fusarium austroafricanum TaxID=2364996 RepID=A0A8H4KAR2_9HYPO|nr:HET-domain-containing protein [Fusarium austroafricanum]